MLNLKTGSFIKNTKKTIGDSEEMFANNNNI